MCGIAAIISKRGAETEKISRMLSAIQHRGNLKPNFEVIGNATLGNVRLQIVDRLNGIQPIKNETGNLAVVFNGEIYNYHALKEELETLGHNFKTDCDTEVLVHLYEEYGIDMLHRLDGMFAFVLYNIETNSFFSARDPFGVKPLYYCIDDNSIYFASELKSFESLNIREYLEVPPAAYFDNYGVKNYHSYKTTPKVSISFEEASLKIRNLTEEAVRKRVQTDLPIGVFLSGGLDSTIVFALCKKYHKDVTALIIGKENAPDVIYARDFCEKNKYKYHLVNVDDDRLLHSVPIIVAEIETFEPNPVRGACLSYYLAQVAHDIGLRIVLCGEGSDEIFGGYGDFLKTNSDNECDLLTVDFLSSLYRTQLLRIDRTGMAFGVEVREPFMDKYLVEYALKLPINFKIAPSVKEKRITKYILREAFKNLLPTEIYIRDKMTLMEGAGAGAVNKGEGIFYTSASKKLTDSEFERIQKEYPAYNLENKEEAFYFNIFKEKYIKAGFAKNRTFNATIEIKNHDRNS